LVRKSSDSERNAFQEKEGGGDGSKAVNPTKKEKDLVLHLNGLNGECGEREKNTIKDNAKTCTEGERRSHSKTRGSITSENETNREEKKVTTITKTQRRNDGPTREKEMSTAPAQPEGWKKYTDGSNKRRNP